MDMDTTQSLDVGLVVVVARREAEVLSPELRVDVLAILCDWVSTEMDTQKLWAERYSPPSLR